MHRGECNYRAAQYTIRTQRNTLAGKSFTKPLLAGTARQALGRRMDVLGVRQEGEATKWAWAKLTKGKMAAASAPWPRRPLLRVLAGVMKHA